MAKMFEPLPLIPIGFGAIPGDLPPAILAGTGITPTQDRKTGAGVP